jgi:hypothetical protein
MNVPNGKANSTPVADALHETAARGVEAIHAIVVQRDELLRNNDRMMTELALFRERTNQLEGRLATATVERDHYMRYCTELTARLNNIQTLISSTIEEAKRAAYRPTAVLTPQVSSTDVAKLENLLQRLPQNGGSTEGEQDATRKTS